MSPSARSLLRDAAFLLMLAVVPALLTSCLHPNRPAWAWSKPAVEQVTLEAIARWKVPVLWVDARSASAYGKQHIPGAVSLNESEWERLLPEFLEAWRPGGRVVVYCDSRACNASDEVARRIKRDLNLEEIFVLKGGWATWQRAKH
jgi:rhodanese-related sulfurtransferase